MGVDGRRQEPGHGVRVRGEIRIRRQHELRDGRRRQEPGHKAAQPRSSEKNAASRAGQTPCARWAVGISLLKLESP